MEIQGKLIHIGDTKNITEKFKKREFVIEYAENENYPQTIAMECQQDNCDALNKFKVGDYVEVTFDLRGRKWVSPAGEIKYFNTLVAWKVQKTGESEEESEVQSDISSMLDVEDPNDLPF